MSESLDLFPVDKIDMAGVVAWLETNPPALSYDSLIGVPSATSSYVQVRRAANQANGSMQVVSFDTTDVDTIGATGTATELVCVQAGFYLAFFSATGNGMSGSGGITSYIERYSSGASLQETLQGPSSGINQTSTISTGFKVNTGDYLEFLVDGAASGTLGNFTARAVMLKLP